MADNFVKVVAGGTYVAIVPGSTTISLAPQDRNYGLRIAISDTQPAPDHDTYLEIDSREHIQQGDIPAGFTLYVRSESPNNPVDVIARAWS